MIFLLLDKILMSEDGYDESNDLYWKPEYAALRNILASQEAELSRVKKAATKKGAKEIAGKKDSVKEVTIDGKTYQAIIGTNGRIKYLDGYKLRDIKNKSLYQQFLEEKASEDPPEGGYIKYRKSKTLPHTNDEGSYDVPLANTQTYRQILSNSIIKEAWDESKKFLSQPGPNTTDAQKRAIRTANLKIYNASLKAVTDDVIADSGIKNNKSEANRNALREYVIQSLNDKNWCQNVKDKFMAKVEELSKTD